MKQETVSLRKQSKPSTDLSNQDIVQQMLKDILTNALPWRYSI